MHLRDYLTEKGLTPAEFAAEIRVHHDAVRKWMRGERTPRPRQMLAINRATQGRVTPNDFHAEGQSAA